jgi:hypothetical protein
MRWIAASEAPKCGPHFEKDGNSSLAKIANNLQADARSLRDRLRAHAGPVRGHARLQPRAVVMVALMAIIGTTLFQVLGLSGQIGETKSALAVQTGEVKAALARSDSGLAKKADVDSVASLTTAIRVSLERIERRLPTTGGQPSPPTPIDLDAPLTLSQLDQLVLRAIFGLNSRDVVTRSRPRNEDL